MCACGAPHPLQSTIQPILGVLEQFWPKNLAEQANPTASPKAAAGSPGTNIARAQQSRWTGIPNEAIMRLVEDKIGSMLEGISDATERNAAAQMQLDLQKKPQIR